MPPLHIGVLIVPPIQLLDLSPIDLFAMATQDYFRACNFPAPLIAIALPTALFKISYIALSGPNTFAPSTPSLDLKITAGLNDESVQPGKLDILLIPGPPPGLRPEDEVLEFVRGHVGAGVDLLTVCTGVFVAGFAGVLEGKRATGTRGVMDVLGKTFPGVKWVDRRYTNDGRIWTAGGITNGMDMVAAYMRQSERFEGQLVDTVLAIADVQDRGQEYKAGKVADSAWWVWNILRAWVGGMGRGKGKAA
ncbi:class I glutamine amidotransferase-like protein [Amniculicola lignicola CBS 123094]|uniref:Class I glutamine amidotransferase-like protein n=1 Tax=Amniculicola lignicola CBS 123094 TaxID=1392246 RepID=A0A6A5X5K7_9PLEO|nr:class I glutamine amidotransferase-like protein [Amniculicola lignicola CBS 123094]